MASKGNKKDVAEEVDLEEEDDDEEEDDEQGDDEQGGDDEKKEKFEDIRNADVVTKYATDIMLTLGSCANCNDLL